ncbi:hypothetical protein, partial [Amycolatopsis sp. SID8362]|uniref:hypothetical protein n=1 Tax=Amycolatopsis sp. SID8362 TaxID=2690346 RepID=UPI00142C4140
MDKQPGLIQRHRGARGQTWRSRTAAAAASVLVLGGASLTTAPAALAAGCTITDGPSLQAAVDAAAGGGGTVTLCADITYTNLAGPGLAIPSGGTVTLSLANHTLTLTGAAGFAGIRTTGATLTINGPGTLSATAGGVGTGGGAGAGVGG